jgi:hypothetical protein
MQSFSVKSRIVGGIMLLLFCLAPCSLIPAAAGADIEMEAYLGETITLHGSSYVGDYVYLFMTGPNLPANGVTLTDTTQRADQGHFTVVGVDDDQEWTYIWKTSRVSSEIDPGTYTVYVTNEKADLSRLGGSGYKTLSVFLKDSGESKVSISAGKSYTLNPEEDLSTPYPAPSINITGATQTVTVPPTSPIVTALPVQATASPTRSPVGPWVVVTALAGCGGLILVLKPRQ